MAKQRRACSSGLAMKDTYGVHAGVEGKWQQEEVTSYGSLYGGTLQNRAPVQCALSQRTITTSRAVQSL
jgi:hypothetical protein